MQPNPDPTEPLVIIGQGDSMRMIRPQDVRPLHRVPQACLVSMVALALVALAVVQA